MNSKIQASRLSFKPQVISGRRSTNHSLTYAIYMIWPLGHNAVTNADKGLSANRSLFCNQLQELRFDINHINIVSHHTACESHDDKKLQ